MTVRERMINLMDDLLKVVHRISENEKATAEELALLPQLTDAIVYITRFAVIEKKEKALNLNMNAATLQKAICDTDQEAQEK